MTAIKRLHEAAKKSFEQALKDKQPWGMKGRKIQVGTAYKDKKHPSHQKAVQYMKGYAVTKTKSDRKERPKRTKTKKYDPVTGLLLLKTSPTLKPSPTWKGHVSFETPLRYRDFLAAGNLSQDWEIYAKEANYHFNKRKEKEFVSGWAQGEFFPGVGFVNLFREHGIETPDKLRKVLQDNDTYVSNISVKGRGLSKEEAKKVFTFVFAVMNYLYEK